MSISISLKEEAIQYHVFESPYFKSYPFVMEEAVRKIESVPGVITLLEKINREGQISIGIDDQGVLKEEAGWHCERRIIIFRLQDILSDSLSLDTKIRSLIFEICNAASSSVFVHLQKQAMEKIVDLEAYVEKVEGMEFLSRRRTDRLLLEGIALHVFSPEMGDDAQSYLIDREINYAFQQLNGHSVIIANRYQSLFTSEKFVYNGIIGDLSGQNQLRLNAILTLFIANTKHPIPDFFPRMSLNLSQTKSSTDSDDVALWQKIEQLFKSKENVMGKIIDTLS